MSDIGLMDYLLTKSEIKVDPEMDMCTNYDGSELMSSDFFDSILSLEKNDLNDYDLDSGIINNLDTSVNLTNYDDMQCETSTFSDSGLSSDLQEMPEQILSDEELLNSILDASPINNVKEQSSSIQIIKPIEYVRPLVKKSTTATVLQQPATEKQQKVINIIKPKQMIRVQPINGNSRSVLLPINLKDLKTIKIINSNNIKAENIKFTSASVRSNKKVNNEKFIIKPVNKDSFVEVNNLPTIQRRTKQPSQTLSTSSEESSTMDDNKTDQYPLLLLTAEEKRLLSKDGIQLPLRYPLTKNEERELKRIRRKIRNKISAQDSRKRKKEYVDGLEERVKQCSEENRSLVKRINMLQMQNSRLSSQLSRLQALVFKTGTSRAHPATCLMIVLLSVMLVTLPNLRNNVATNDLELNSLQQYVARRALLFSQQATTEDSVSLNMDEFITFPGSNKNVAKKVTSSDMGNVVINNNDMIDNNDDEELLSKFNYDNFIMDNDYGDDGDDDGGGGGDRAGLKRYIEPEIDEYWPPVKKRNLTETEVATATATTNEYFK